MEGLPNMVSRMKVLSWFTISALFLALTLHAQQRKTPTDTHVKEAAQRAMKFFDEKKYDSAIVNFREAIRLDPSNSDYEYEIALAFALKQDVDSSISILERIKTSSKSTDRYYQLLGNLYAQRDDSMHARLSYRDGLKTFPSSGKLHMKL